MSSGSEYILKVEGLRAFHSSKDGLVKAVNDVSFGIRKGEAVGLLGESGAGKTSVALSIIGMFDQLSRYYASTAANDENKRLWSMRDKARKEGLTSTEMGVELPGVDGHIWFNGIDLMGLSDDDIRKIRGNKITYVPQGTSKSLNPRRTIESQAVESLWAHFKDTMTEDEDTTKKVLEILDLVELGDMAIRQEMFPSDFSSGEDQRVLIAMALITKPDLIITDEPTTALDAAVRHKILKAINLARKEFGMSVLMVTNDAGIVAETCDTVGVMSAGSMMEFGDVATIMNSPKHPFTRAFMMSNPSMEMLRRLRERGERLKPIPGRPPSAINLPQGCPFNPRCEYANHICRETTPEYREIDDNHWIFCHLAETLPEL
ncbi:MAG: ABC transporter ATP-binding protein [Candidatus Thorarchaeota archaeon]